MKKRAKKNPKFSLFWGILFLSFVMTLAVSGLMVWKKIEQKYPWLLPYFEDRMQPAPKISGTKHIMFLVADHFEPHDQESMDRWMSSYPAMAGKHKDSDGKYPQHTFFWFFSHSDTAQKKSFLNQLSKLAYAGYGEIELHMHHFNDNEETFLTQMNEALQLSREAGAMITAEPKPRTAFGFIHGLWSLDNSRGAGACGVNNELILLRQLGCYADFTHPSWGVMHPSMINTIYYATDDPQKPKSYDTGSEMEAGKPGLGDLLIFEGPSVVRLKGLKLDYDEGDLSHLDLPTEKRVDDWVKTSVHVKGRPEWIFIKVHTHGAQNIKDHDALLGPLRSKMHAYLESKYNDGKNYQLHYVTAREAYNIAKAAEAGKTGNPNDYRDYEIVPYVQNYFTANAPFETRSFNQNRAVFQFLAPAGTLVKARLKAVDVKGTGNAVDFRFTPKEGETEIEFKTTEKGLVGFSFKRVSE